MCQAWRRRTEGHGFLLCFFKVSHWSVSAFKALPMPKALCKHPTAWGELHQLYWHEPHRVRDLTGNQSRSTHHPSLQCVCILWGGVTNPKEEQEYVLKTNSIIRDGFLWNLRKMLHCRSKAKPEYSPASGYAQEPSLGNMLSSKPLVWEEFH